MTSHTDPDSLTYFQVKRSSIFPLRLFIFLHNKRKTDDALKMSTDCASSKRSFSIFIEQQFGLYLHEVNVVICKGVGRQGNPLNRGYLRYKEWAVHHVSVSFVSRDKKKRRKK